jgi:hypothetical protein
MLLWERWLGLAGRAGDFVFLALPAFAALMCLQFHVLQRGGLLAQGATNRS